MIAYIGDRRVYTGSFIKFAGHVWRIEEITGHGDIELCRYTVRGAIRVVVDNLDLDVHVVTGELLAA
jgi:hypothetical protein